MLSHRSTQVIICNVAGSVLASMCMHVCILVHMWICTMDLLACTYT